MGFRPVNSVIRPLLFITLARDLQYSLSVCVFCLFCVSCINAAQCEIETALTQMGKYITNWPESHMAICRTGG